MSRACAPANRFKNPLSARVRADERPRFETRLLHAGNFSSIQTTLRAVERTAVRLVVTCVSRMYICVTNVKWLIRDRPTSAHRRRPARSRHVTKSNSNTRTTRVSVAIEFIQLPDRAEDAATVRARVDMS